MPFELWKAESAKLGEPVVAGAERSAFGRICFSKVVNPGIVHRDSESRGTPEQEITVWPPAPQV